MDVISVEGGSKFAQASQIARVFQNGKVNEIRLDLAAEGLEKGSCSILCKTQKSNEQQP